MSWISRMFSSNRQYVLLLGPQESGKSELVKAVEDLQTINESKEDKIRADMDSREAEKAEKNSHHSDETTMKTKITGATLKDLPLKFVDDGGYEQKQHERIRVFICNVLKKKPLGSKKGVFCFVLFDVRDVIDQKAEHLRDVQCSYRDLIEIWGSEIYPQEENSGYVSQEEQMVKPKAKKKEKPFHPPLSVIFIATHVDCTPMDKRSQTRSQVAQFVNTMMDKAKDYVELPREMREIELPAAEIVLADLKDPKKGRLDFREVLYKKLTEMNDANAHMS